MSIPRIVVILALGLALGACSGRVGTQAGQDCSAQLTLAEQELEDAKVKGLGGTIQWTKAAGLIVSARTQQQLERFESCLDKVQRARLYLREAQK